MKGRRQPVEPLSHATDADRAAAFPDVAGHGVHDAKQSTLSCCWISLNTRMLTTVVRWLKDAKGWIGGDIDRLWLRSEGERTNGVTESAELSALWGHSIGPWWDVVTGVRQDFKPGSPQAWAALAFRAWPSTTSRPKRLPTSVRTVNRLLDWKAITTFC